MKTLQQLIHTQTTLWTSSQLNGCEMNPVYAFGRDKRKHKPS